MFKYLGGALLVLLPCLAQADFKVRVGQEILVTRLDHDGSLLQSHGKLDLKSALPETLGSLAFSSEDGRYSVISLSDNSGLSVKGQERVLTRRALKNVCALVHSKLPSAACEANVIYKISKVPNDASYSELYGLVNIGAPSAWDFTTGSSAIKVAVVDTGVDYTHPDLVSNIALNTSEIPNNGIDDDGNGYVDDYYGYDLAGQDSDPFDENEHGSHCSGTIGGTGDDGVGVVGVNWTVGIVPVRVLDASGSGTLADVAAGVDYATARGVDVISMSLGGSDSARALKDSIQRAMNAGILVAVAAGNEGSDNDSVPSYPANYTLENIISVAATDSEDRLADFSNFGSVSVDIAAPGVGILSTLPGGRYDYFDGTSMATPHVAGAAALVKAANPLLTWYDIKTLLFSTADAKGSLSGTSVTGARLNVGAAVAAALGTTPTTPPGSGGGRSPNDATVKISIADKAAVKAAKASIRGVIKNSGGALPDEALFLICNGKDKGSTASGSSGAYRFSLKRDPKKTLRCRVEDDFGTISKTLKVKPRGR